MGRKVILTWLSPISGNLVTSSSKSGSYIFFEMK